jgi:hypothetical protein
VTNWLRVGQPGLNSDHSGASSAKLYPHLHLVPSLRMPGALPPFLIVDLTCIVSAERKRGKPSARVACLGSVDCTPNVGSELVGNFPGGRGGSH